MRAFVHECLSAWTRGLIRSLVHFCVTSCSIFDHYQDWGRRRSGPAGLRKFIKKLFISLRSFQLTTSCILLNVAWLCNTHRCRPSAYLFSFVSSWRKSPGQLSCVITSWSVLLRDQFLCVFESKWKATIQAVESRSLPAKQRSCEWAVSCYFVEFCSYAKPYQFRLEYI